MVPKTTAQTHKINSELVTVLLIDLVGYTKTTAALDRDNFNKLHNVFDSLVVPVIKEYNGNIINKIGDAFLASFRSPTNAVLCAMALQRTFTQANHEKRFSQPLKARIVAHTGEIVIRKDSSYGKVINIASRIEKFAVAGEILFTGSVFSVINENEIPYEYVGLKHVKGIQYPIKLYRVTKSIKYKNKRVKKAIGGTLIAIIILLLIVFGALALISLI